MIFKGFLFIITALHYSWTLSDKYIDLLELSDNDVFQWSLHENNDFNKINESSLADYHLRPKRQANGNDLLQTNKAYDSCRTPQGETGHCRHIIYCRMPELKNDVWRIVSQLCIIEKTTIGICCPDRTSSRLGPQIVTDINSNELNELRVVNRPEQRGCGVTTKQFPRIGTSGRPAEPDEWPWMAALLRPGLPYVWCGGVLVTDRHVLTAAHCVHKLDKNNIIVRLGEYNTRLLNETRARDFSIGNLVTHIDYNPLTYEHDIALLRIERATLFNTYIWPVCMPPIGEEWEGREGVVTGWGTQSFGGPHSDILMEVALPIWKQKDCQDVMLERIPDTNICAGHPEGGQDSCQGDSGGPLLLQLPNLRWVTIGIVSWGVRCGERMRPGMYTRVDKYLHWIIENSDI